MVSGSLLGKPGTAWKGDGRGRMANAPPAPTFQFTLIYRCFGKIRVCKIEFFEKTYSRSRDYVCIPRTVSYLDVF
jgi:hypothetical protein